MLLHVAAVVVVLVDVGGGLYVVVATRDTFGHRVGRKTVSDRCKAGVAAGEGEELDVFGREHAAAPLGHVGAIQPLRGGGDGHLGVGGVGGGVAGLVDRGAGQALVAVSHLPVEGADGRAGRVVLRCAGGSGAARGGVGPGGGRWVVARAAAAGREAQRTQRGQQQWGGCGRHGIPAVWLLCWICSKHRTRECFAFANFGI